MNTKRTARAVVYAARMAHLINQYGHTWANIEATTKAILEGHPVPPDNQTVDPELGALVEPVNPGDCVERVALGLVDKYHATKQELANVREALRIEVTAALEARRQATNQLAATQSVMKERDAIQTQLAEIEQRATELGAELVKARATAEQLRKDNAALRGTRDPELSMAWAARDNWRTFAANAAQERDKALEDLKGSELCRDQLRRDLHAMTLDRDGYKRGAQFWLDEANARTVRLNDATFKVEKLRTFLQPFTRYDTIVLHESVCKILEETK